MMTDALSTIGGLVLLMVGADYLVRGAVAIARCVGVSPLVIGLTVVAFGTSLPELVVCMQSALDGVVGVAVGNVVGSNIANILLILGAAGVISPIRCTRMACLRDGSAMLAATVFFIAFGMMGTLGALYGALGLLLLAAYMFWSYRSDQAAGNGLHAQEAEDVEPIRGSIWLAALAVAGGLVGVVVGAQLLVDGAVGIARTFGVSEEVIGLTLVAFGTSVPELATTIVAAYRRHADVALGNVLGSNLFNLLGVMGATTLIVPMELPPQIASFDIWVMAGVSLLMVQFMYTGWRLSRPEAAVFLVGYGAFITIQFYGVGAFVTLVAGL